MKKNPRAKIVGKARIRVYRDGALILDSPDPNLITNVGVAGLASLLNGESSSAFNYIALGEGTSPADVDDVALETEVTFGGGSRALGTTSMATTTLTDDTAEIEATFNITADVDLTEIGLFNASSGGTLAARRVFSEVSLGNGDTVIVTWSLTVLA